MLKVVICQFEGQEILYDGAGIYITICQDIKRGIPPQQLQNYQQ